MNYFYLFILHIAIIYPWGIFEEVLAPYIPYFSVYKNSPFYSLEGLVRYITNADYTLLKFKIARGFFFKLWVNFFFRISRPIRSFFLYLTDRSSHSATLELAATGGGWPLHTYPTLTVSRHSVIRALHRSCDILLPTAAVNLQIIYPHFRRFLCQHNDNHI